VQAAGLPRGLAHAGYWTGAAVGDARREQAACHVGTGPGTLPILGGRGPKEAFAPEDRLSRALRRSMATPSGDRGNAGKRLSELGAGSLQSSPADLPSHSRVALSHPRPPFPLGLNSVLLSQANLSAALMGQNPVQTGATWLFPTVPLGPDGS
jgi:hypothetical protein